MYYITHNMYTIILFTLLYCRPISNLTFVDLYFLINLRQRKRKRETDTNYVALVLGHFRLRAGLFFKISEPKFNEFRLAPANRFESIRVVNRPALVFFRRILNVGIEFKCWTNVRYERFFHKCRMA